MIGELYNCNMISRRLLQRIYFDLMSGQTAQDLLALTQLTYTVNDRLINGPAKQFVKEEMHTTQKEAERRFGHMVNTIDFESTRYIVIIQIFQAIQVFIPKVLEEQQLQDNVAMELQNLYNTVAFSQTKIE